MTCIYRQGVVPLPPVLLPRIKILAVGPRIIVLATVPRRVVKGGTPSPQPDPVVTARAANIGWTSAHRQAALWLVVQRHDEFCVGIRLSVKRLVRNDERRSRQCVRRDTIEHILRHGDAVE